MEWNIHRVWCSLLLNFSFLSFHSPSLCVEYILKIRFYGFYYYFFCIWSLCTPYIVFIAYIQHNLYMCCIYGVYNAASTSHPTSFHNLILTLALLPRKSYHHKIYIRKIYENVWGFSFSFLFLCVCLLMYVCVCVFLEWNGMERNDEMNRFYMVQKNVKLNYVVYPGNVVRTNTVFFLLCSYSILFFILSILVGIIFFSEKYSAWLYTHTHKTWWKKRTRRL